ncbi:MAG: biotin/lipoyl-binding protein, partial [Gammaproteobacteria bacterium]|nr:biotin/lipoyl-binding protein [Gammaproteobacteria bacterium]
GTGKVTDYAESTASAPAAQTATPVTAGTAAETIKAPLSGSVIDIPVSAGDQVSSGQVVIIIEAMKMETQLRCSSNGHIASIDVAKGDHIQVDQALLTIS